MIKAVEKQQLKVPAHIDYLGDLRDFVTQIGRKHGFSDKVINAFKLSVDEAATNIIRHAYRETEGLITIRAIVKKNSLTISLLDQGKYFDPKRVKDPDLNRYVDIGKKGGLGIFIMRKLMDEIDYRRTEEGNELRITKNRDSVGKKKLLSSVSTIPFSIKAKYFLRTIAIIAGLIFITYIYFFLVADNRVENQFLANWRTTNSQIVSRIASLPPEQLGVGLSLESGPEIYESYKDQLLKLSVEDSTGFVEFSSADLNLDDLTGAEGGKRFSRPSDFEELEPGLYKYRVGDETLYEFETPIVLKDIGKFYGKAHVFWSSEKLDAEIGAIRWDYTRIAFIVFGLSSVFVIVLIYLVMNPFRKLSEWVKNLGSGDIEDEIDIDSSTEIGEIAQAFSGMTKQLRESQKNLADQERIKKEMQVAQEIQQTLLPMEFPELEGYEIAAYYEAAKEVGGDYYDFVEVDKDTLGIAVADVSGKGVPGSLVMTMIRTALRTEARGIKDAAKVLSRVNTFVSSDIKKGMFVTVFYLIIDSKKRSLNYASAGHNPMVLYRGSTNQTYYLNPKGFPIGVQLPEKDYFDKYIESDTIKLTKDDILLLYTDGITEAMNSSRELFGEERLQRVLREHGHLGASDFAENLKNDIYSFTEGTPQYDDITLVTIKERSTREEDELRRAKEAHDLIAKGLSIQKACDEVNLTTYAYYNKYKPVFDEEGTEAFEVQDETSVEVKHLSIEEKTKIYDIISNHPEFGASRIKDELNTETYGNWDLSESKIYDFLVRERLNTRQLREAYIQRTRSNKRRMKPPGTPMMTLDGSLIIQKPKEPTLPPPGKADATPTEPVERELDEDTIDIQGESIVAEQTPTTEDREDSVEATSLLDTPLEEFLSGDESEADILAGDETEPPSEAPHDDTDDMTHASISEMISGSDDFDDADDMEQSDDADDVIDEPVDSPEKPPLESDAGPSFEDLVDSDDSATLDEFLTDAPETEDEESFNEVEQVNGKKEAEESPTEAEDVYADSEEDDDEDLTISSIDELLSVDEDDDEDEEDYEFESQKSSEEISQDTDPNKEFVDRESGSEESSQEDSLSFSDLIQAIDDEIVYVTEPSSRHNQSRKASENSGGAVSEDKEKSNDTLEPKEKTLIAGIKFYKNQEYAKAIKELEKVTERFPDFKEAHSILGNAYFRSKKYNEAAEAYKKVKNIDPDDVTAYENMGVIYANRGNYKEALTEWKRVLELNPNRNDIKDKIRKTVRMLG